VSDSPSTQITVRQFIEQASVRLDDAGAFYGHGTDNAWDDAVFLTLVTLGLEHDDPSAAERPITPEELRLLEARLAARSDQRIPVAYLVGEAWFAGRRFLADKRALVPRSPIAELLNGGGIPFLDHAPAALLDLCCGGGSIGITAAHEFPEARVDLADLSSEALALAAENVALHQMNGRLSLLQSDLFESIPAAYDLILTNPPYVAAEEMTDIPDEYRHEPEMGLVCDDDGLGLPLRILRDAAEHLNPGGVLVMEVGYSHPQLSARLTGVPLVWLEFEQGGEGVFAITRADLCRYREHFI
jgi:ribosomal protein L3 glutamine methyltransferase